MELKKKKQQQTINKPATATVSVFVHKSCTVCTEINHHTNHYNGEKDATPSKSEWMTKHNDKYLNYLPFASNIIAKF